MSGRDVDAIGGFLFDPSLHLVAHVLTGADDGQVLLGLPSDALAQLKNAQAFSLGGLVVHLRGAAQPDDLQVRFRYRAVNQLAWSFHCET